MAVDYFAARMTAVHQAVTNVLNVGFMPEEKENAVY